MAAEVMTVSSGLVLGPDPVERLWFFPDGSEYLRYAPHFHTIQRGGFRTNFPLSHGFFIVLEGKLSVKNFYGGTVAKIEVRDQVWYLRGMHSKSRWYYSLMIPPRIIHQPDRRTRQYV